MNFEIQVARADEALFKYVQNEHDQSAWRLVRLAAGDDSDTSTKGDSHRSIGQTLQGSFSAVSKPIFASKY